MFVGAGFASTGAASPRGGEKKTPSGRAERGEAGSPLGNNVIKHNNRHANKDQNDDVKFNLHIKSPWKMGRSRSPAR
jgi:hypothetical protein